MTALGRHHSPEPTRPAAGRRRQPGSVAPRLAALSAALVALLCGCAGAPGAADAVATARALNEAAAAGDGDAACALLAPRTALGIEEQTGQTCADAVLALPLPPWHDDAHTERYGRQAQVRTSTDVVFLVRSGDAWLVTAAGCEPRPPLPYDCAVEAG